MATAIYKIINNDKVSFLSLPYDTLEAVNSFSEMLNKFVEDGNGSISYKKFSPNNIPLEELPEDIQSQVKSTLRAYDKVTVSYEHLTFSVSASCCIKSSYNWDHFVAGTYKATEVYTLEERRQNYIEEFGYSPCF